MIIDNIFKYIEYKGISAYQISKNIDVSSGYLVKTKQNKGNVGGQILEKIINFYPDLNPEWLLTGQGEMIKKKNINDIFEMSNLNKNINGLNEVKLLTSNVIKKKKIMNKELEKEEIKCIQINQFLNGVSHVIIVEDDSMFPEYVKNCVLFLQEVSDRNSVIENRNYVIETENYRVVKRIIKSKEKDLWTCCSSSQERHLHNGKLIHEPFDVYDKEIIKFYNILGFLNKN